MSIKIISSDDKSVKLEVVINFEGDSFLETEEHIMNEINKIGQKVTQNAMEKLEIKENKIVVNKQTLYAKKKIKTYQSPYGEIEVERKIFAPLKKGKSVCPVEINAHIIRTSTPKFAKILSSKYIHQAAKSASEDLRNNHNRVVSENYIRDISQLVDNKIKKCEENFTYELPTIPKTVTTIALGIDGTCMPMGDTTWREAMCGTISLYDKKGDRLNTIYIANSTEYGKKEFKEKMDKEIIEIKKKFPKAKIIGVADGARENWKFFEKYTDSNILDFYHATEYLAKASKGFHSRSIPKQKSWFEKACGTLKNTTDGAKKLLDEIKKLTDEKLSAPVRKGVEATISYFNNNLARMNYKNSIDEHLPIGSGVTESACKILVKQRVCISGANWSEYGIKRFLPMRAICLSDGRWNQVWDRMMKDVSFFGK